MCEGRKPVRDGDHSFTYGVIRDRVFDSIFIDCFAVWRFTETVPSVWTIEGVGENWSTECVETGLSMPLIVPTVWTVVFDFFRFFEYAKGDAKSKCVLYMF